MDQYLQMIVTVVCAVLASSGFWAYLQHRRDKKDLKTRLLIGLAHDEIIRRASKYIKRGWITWEEYRNLQGIFKPYSANGGNGSAAHIMEKIETLQIKELEYDKEDDEDDE